MRALFIGAVVLAVGVGIGASVAGDPATTGGARKAAKADRTATVGCTRRVEGDSPASAEARREARRASIFLPEIRFWGLREARTQSLAPGSGPDGGDPIVKSGVSVRAPRPVTVKVAPADRGWVALDYDVERWREQGRTVAGGGGETAVRFVPCDPDTPRFSRQKRRVGRWTGWAGGFLVARPGCATLLVRAAGASEWRHVPVAFGADC